MSTSLSTLSAQNITVGYDKHLVIEDLSISFPREKFTAIIGPNGCGKSTLLNALCRLLLPTKGVIALDGQDILHYANKDLAQKISLLAQDHFIPDGITVRELVLRGRFPYQTFFNKNTLENEAIVEEMMQKVRIAHLAYRKMEELSGGQKQRVWIAMLLAQQTPLLFLDEPTTWLDITHQIEILSFFRKLNQEEGKTIIAILHDLNQAGRYADHIIMMKKGQIMTQGTPQEVMTQEWIKKVFNLSCQIITDPVSQTPLIIPEDIV